MELRRVWGGSPHFWGVRQLAYSLAHLPAYSLAHSLAHSLVGLQVGEKIESRPRRLDKTPPGEPSMMRREAIFWVGGVMREKPKERPQGSLIEKTTQKQVEGKQICLKVNPQGLVSVKSAFLPFRSSKNSPSEWLKTDPAADQNRGGICIIVSGEALAQGTSGIRI